MDIGTAKPSYQERQNYHHHLLDLCTPVEHYDLAHYLRDAHICITRSYAQGRVPIIVGGTMMYYHALSQGLNHLPAAQLLWRSSIQARAQALGWATLHAELTRIDAAYAAKIQPQDAQRIGRGLEIYYAEKQKPSSYQNQAHSPYQCHTVALNMPRPDLHRIIEQRFQQMLQKGLAEEVQQLQKQYPDWHMGHSAMRCVGYRQMVDYFTHQNAMRLQDEGMAASRQLAKRQITWLNKLQVPQIMYTPDAWSSAHKQVETLFIDFLKKYAKMI